MENKAILEGILTSEDPGGELQRLRGTGWLLDNLPEVYWLYGVPQRADHHPEIDVGIHVELSLAQTVRFGGSADLKFAVLVHDLGKGITPARLLPGHPDHEKTGLPLVEAVCDRFEVSEYRRKLATTVCLQHLNHHRSFINRSRTLLRIIALMGVEQDDQLLKDFGLACKCDATGRKGLQDNKYDQYDFFQAVVRDLRLSPINYGPDFQIADKMTKEQHQRYNERLEIVRSVREVYRPSKESKND